MGRPGHAELEYRLWAGSSVGVSDNPRVQSASTSTTDADGFVTGQGRFQLSHIGALTREDVTYGIVGTTWFQNTQGSSLTQILRLSSDIQASPGTRIMLNGGAAWARMSMLDTAAAVDPQAVGPRPAGDQQFVTFDAGEAVSWEPSASWRLDQGLQGRLYRPIGSAQSSASNKSLTLETQVRHLWQRDGVGLRARAGVIASSGTAQAGQPVPESRDGEFAESMLSWTHEWTPDFSHELAAGVFVMWAGQTRVLPAGSASLLWRRNGNEIGLRAGQTAESNIYVGTAYERSFVGLRVALPVDRRELLRLFADGNLEHDSTAASSAGAQVSANILTLRAGLGWQPGDTFEYSLEYTFRDQRASATDSGPSLFPTYRRHMALLTIGLHYPSGP